MLLSVLPFFDLAAWDLPSSDSSPGSSYGTNGDEITPQVCQRVKHEARTSEQGLAWPAWRASSTSTRVRDADGGRPLLDFGSFQAEDGTHFKLLCACMRPAPGFVREGSMIWRLAVLLFLGGSAAAAKSAEVEGEHDTLVLSTRATSSCSEPRYWSVVGSSCEASRRCL